MKRILFVTIVSILFCLTSCQKAPFLTVNGPKSYTFQETGGSQTFTFSANREWKVSSSDSWIRVSPSSGTAADGEVKVTISCDPNTTYDARNATLTLKVEELTETINVSQETNYGIIVPTKSYDLTSAANTIEVEVQANVQYTVSVSDTWIKQSGTKGLTSNKISFSVDENTSYDARSASITIKPASIASGVQEQVISVRQAQKDVLIVKDASFSLPYGGGAVEVKVESNVDFDVTPSVDWIHYVETKALSNSTVRLSVDENETYSKREGKIEIKQKNGALSHTVTLKQAGRIAVTSIALNKTSLTLKEGGTATLTATVKPKNATFKTVTWSSSDSNCASVDENGKVVAIKGGTATITAQAEDKTATCVVTVEIPVSSVEINKTQLALTVGENYTLTAFVKPDDATNKEITWLSSNPKIVSVDNGKLTAIKLGKATITASCDGVSTDCVVSVLSEGDLNLESNVTISLTGSGFTITNTGQYYARYYRITNNSLVDIDVYEIGTSNSIPLVTTIPAGSSYATSLYFSFNVFPTVTVRFRHNGHEYSISGGSQQ